MNLVLRIWLKIFFILLLVAVPLVIAQYFLQKESIEITLNLADRLSPAELIDSHLESLKKLSKLDPAESARYRDEFNQTLQLRNLKNDVIQVRGSLARDLLLQGALAAAVVLLVSLALSFAISRNIVGVFRKLLEENKLQARRLEKLGSLESWQHMARVLVHELRAPITPIKLVSTDIEEKYASLDPPSFKKYLAQGARLVQAQVAVVESMVESFTRFAKLPEVKRRPDSISNCIQQFVTAYQDFSAKQVTFSVVLPDLLQDQIPIDTDLIQQLLFNLLKNATEANPNQRMSVDIRVQQLAESTKVRFCNSGALIPEQMASKIFDLYVSTKKTAGSTNLGMGLAIAKKIALDHGGDLLLASNSPESGVVFELELPNK